VSANGFTFGQVEETVIGVGTKFNMQFVNDEVYNQLQHPIGERIVECSGVV